MKLTLRAQFTVMLATAALLPLLIYGVVSIYSLRQGITTTLADGNLNVALQVGEQVRRYVSTSHKILLALASDLDATGLSRDQQDLILKNYALRFPEFRELSVFDDRGALVATSRAGTPSASVPPADTPTVFGVRMTPVRVDADLLPTSVVATPLGRGRRLEGWLVGEFSIEGLWSLVNDIRIGASGYVLIVDPGGRLLAHGNPVERSRVARGERMVDDALVAELRRKGAGSTAQSEVTRANGERMLAVGARVPELDWMVIVEEPRDEAYAVALQNERGLLSAITLAMLVAVIAGFAWGRSLIRPVRELIRGTEAIAEGRLDQRVHIDAGGEIAKLGEAFNSMTDRLSELQDNVRKQERHAMFGRVAAGLVHDLSHPFKNIQNNCRLMLKMHDDEEYRDLFRRTTDREFAHIKRVFEDLRNIARPPAVELIALDLHKLLLDVAESMRGNAEAAGVTLELDLADDALFVLGDVFALSRVTRNLVLNAIEATPPQGTITVASCAAGPARAEVRVSDTGCGIPPDRLPSLFEDFATTKRQGLGLGLAISKKNLDQMGGTIRAESAVGQGTTFVVTLVRAEAPPAAV